MKGALSQLTAALTLALALVGFEPTPVRAQGVELSHVETLVENGEVDEARSALERWWDQSRESASRDDIQLAYFLRARLTVNAHDAELDYRRLVIDFPGGRYSDDALLRLADGAHSRGDLVEAASLFRTLLRDYPTSPHRIRAQDWLERFGPAADRAREAADSAPPEVEDAPPPVVSEPEAGVAPEQDEESASPEEGGESDAAASASDDPYAVQLGAFASEDRAWRLADRARSAGLSPRLARIPGSSLLRVRVGHFPDSPSAEQILREVRRLGFEATIVTDVLEEIPVR